MAWAKLISSYYSLYDISYKGQILCINFSLICSSVISMYCVRWDVISCPDGWHRFLVRKIPRGKKRTISISRAGMHTKNTLYLHKCSGMNPRVQYMLWWMEYKLPGCIKLACDFVVVQEQEIWVHNGEVHDCVDCLFSEDILVQNMIWKCSFGLQIALNHLFGQKSVSNFAAVRLK